MWEDIFKMIEDNDCDEYKIVEKFKSGFIVLIEGAKEFVTKDDFVNVWCMLLYYNEISKDKIKNDDAKSEYVYKLITDLPYIKENSGTIKLIK